MSNELNPLEEEEPGSLTPELEDEEEIEGDLFGDDEISDEEKTRIALETLNRVTGKTYKSLEDYAKSEKERDKLFAQTTPPKKEKPEPRPAQQAMDPDIQEALLYATYPELRNAPETVKELQEAASLKGKSLFSIYKESTYLRNRAKDESSGTEEDANKERVFVPGPVVHPKKGETKPTEEDVRIATKYFHGDVERYMKVKAQGSGVIKK